MLVFARLSYMMPSSLSRQLVLLITAFILATSMVVAVPAYLLIRAELDHQTALRLSEARRHAVTLVAAQQRDINNLVQLAAERPTLRQLVDVGDTDALDGYLDTLREGTALDFVVVNTADGGMLSSSVAEGVTLPETDSELEWAALTHSATVNETTTVTGGVLLDDAFVTALASQTNMPHSLLQGGFRFAASLDTFEDTLAGVDTLLVAGNNSYVREIAPLDGHDGVELEVLLPIDDLIIAERRALAALVASTFVLALLGAGIGSVFVRRTLAPLGTLTHAAEAIGRGALNAPVQVATNTQEIRLLADTMEATRLNLLTTLERLAQARNWSEALIQAIAEGIVTFDTDGQITFFSEGAARITGYTVFEATNKPVDSILVTPEGSAPFAEQIPDVEGRQLIPVLVAHDDVKTLAVTRSRPTRIGQTTVVLHDITEETHLRNLQAYFIANISHEFRTPLSGLRVSIELLMENAPYLSPAETDELLNSILLSVSSLQSLIDNLLESTKIEAQHFTLRRRHAEFSAIVADTVRVMQPILNRRRQRLSLTQPLTLPTLYVDPVRVTQVLVNLLSNASKYSPQDTIIDLRATASNGLLRVEIEDRGGGIPPEEREDIFRRFLRLEHTDSEDYGVGLGLFVVKSIVEGHGGTVGVKDRDSADGSIFWFTLPLELEVQGHEA